MLNYTTTIEVSKTIGECTSILMRRGVTKISTAFDSAGDPQGLGFVMSTEFGMREFEIPIRTAGVLRAIANDPKVSASKRTPEQAARVAWRIAKDWLEVQGALVDAGLATVDEVMLPWMIANEKGDTAYQLYRRNQKEIER